MQDPNYRQPESAAHRAGPPPAAVRARRPGELDNDEEAYFAEGSDDDDDDSVSDDSPLRGRAPAGAPAPPRALVQLLGFVHTRSHHDRNRIGQVASYEFTLERVDCTRSSVCLPRYLGMHRATARIATLTGNLYRRHTRLTRVTGFAWTLAARARCRAARLGSQSPARRHRHAARRGRSPRRHTCRGCGRGAKRGDRVRRRHGE